jgi:menaquinone-dependent protoporphyrinogen oxidase
MSERLKNVLVAYSTLSGCTTTIAHRIGADLIAYGARPVLASVEELATIPGHIDAVVFGSGMRMGKFHKDAREWLLTNEEALSRRPLGLFSVGLRPATPQQGMRVQAERELDAQLANFSHLHPVHPVVLPGWKRSEGFSTVEKIALKVYPLEDGDYRDWDKVDAWVRDVAPILVGHGPRVGNLN